jgi:hypothetical protein
MGYYTMRRRTLSSCKIFASPNCRNYPEKRHCLALEHNREEVLGDLEGTNHQNIRNFRKSGWDRCWILRWSSLKKIIKKLLYLQNMRWTIKPKPSDDNQTFSLKCRRFCSATFSATRHRNFEDAKLSFRPSLEHLHDPYWWKIWTKQLESKQRLKIRNAY